MAGNSEWHDIPTMYFATDFLRVLQFLRIHTKSFRQAISPFVHRININEMVLTPVGAVFPGPTRKNSARFAREMLCEGACRR